MATAGGSGEATAAAMLDSLGHAVIATDRDGVVTYWNSAAERLYGWTAAEATGRPIYELTVPGPMQEYAAQIMSALDAGQAWSGMFTVRCKDGSSFPALVTDTGLRDAAGNLVGVVGVSVAVGDITEPFLRRSQEAVVVTDAQGVIRVCSPVLTALTGWPAEELTGRLWWQLLHPDDLAAARAAHAETVAGRELVAPVEHRLHCSDGSWRWVETAETRLLDEPAVRGILLTLRDVSERRARVAELSRRALHDELTGLVNRAVFMEQLGSHLAGRNHRGAVLYIDLDQFKSINDRLGHLAGDQVLREVADRIRAAVRPEDVCGRLGGDEFGVLAPGLTVPKQALALARRISSAVSRPLQVRESAVTPAASVGVAMLVAIDDPDHALSLADSNMYHRKGRRAGARRRAARLLNPTGGTAPRLPRQRHATTDAGNRRRGDTH